MPHPSDQELEQNLRAHEKEFDKLIRLIEEDADLVRIGPKNVFFNGNSNRRQLPEARIAEYRRLMHALGIQGGIHRDRNGTMRLIASSKGAVVPNSEKSYVYSRITPFPLVESLDQLINENRGDHQPVYKKLYGDWYLYYESW
ncbi:MAG TPA: hypothetical protein VJU84_18150 [Pyrinomonadaceae bacterium]|nr:hypothetical protein [Pyrinomonadaceae bacterium]